MKTFTFQPVGLDLWDRRKTQPEPGQKVIKVQPRGCPKNGTMRHCYVQTVEPPERGPVLVLEASLIPA